MYCLAIMLLAYVASARPLGHRPRFNGLRSAAPGGAGDGGSSEVGVFLLSDPFLSPLSSVLPRPQPRIAYYESSTDAPAIPIQSSTASYRFEGDEAGEDEGNGGSPRPSPGVRADSDERLSLDGTSSPLPDVASVRGGGGDHPTSPGGGALGGQAPFPTLSRLGAGDGGSGGLTSKDALSSGNGTGPPTIEGRGSSAGGGPADVLVS